MRGQLNLPPWASALEAGVRLARLRAQKRARAKRDRARYAGKKKK